MKQIIAPCLKKVNGVLFVAVLICIEVKHEKIIHSL